MEEVVAPIAVPCVKVPRRPPLAPKAVGLVDVVANPSYEIHKRLGAREAIWAEHGVIDEGRVRCSVDIYQGCELLSGASCTPPARLDLENVRPLEIGEALAAIQHVRQLAHAIGRRCLRARTPLARAMWSYPDRAPG